MPAPTIATDNDPRRPRSLATNEGFYLNLENSWRPGDIPGGDHVVHAAVSYVFVPHQYVTYFFMYGYNVPANTAKRSACGMPRMTIPKYKSTPTMSARTSWPCIHLPIFSWLRRQRPST